MHITIFIIQAYYLSALAVVNCSPPPVPGRITNTDALAKGYLNATAVKNDSCSTASCDNITEVIYAKNSINASMADATNDTSTDKTLKGTLLHIRQ